MNLRALAKIKHLLLDGMFPPLCLHCQSLVDTSGQHFCGPCSFFFDLIESSLRCPHCFCEMERKRACHTCIENKRWDYQVAAALVKRGPVATMQRKMQDNRYSYLTKSAASFMALQFLHLGWSADYLISPRKLLWGKSLLAQELSSLLNLPVIRSDNKKLIMDKKVVLILDVLDNKRLEKPMKKVLDCYPEKVSVLTFCI